MLIETKLIRWLWQIRIRQILYLYLLINTCFGVVYFLIATYFSPSHMVIAYNGIPAITSNWAGLFNAIYFSFVSASALGYGDMVPIGALKLIAIIQVISGLALFSFFVTKLVSKKQEYMLEHIYNTSFEEKSRTLRSGFYLLRNNVDALIAKVKTKNISKHELSDSLSLQMMSFSTHMNELHQLLKQYVHMKDLDEEKLILHLLLCLKSFTDLLSLIHKNKKELNKKEVKLSKDLVIQSVLKLYHLFEEHKHNISLSGYSKRIRLKTEQLQRWIKKVIT